MEILETLLDRWDFYTKVRKDFYFSFVKKLAYNTGTTNLAISLLAYVICDDICSIIKSLF